MPKVNASGIAKDLEITEQGPIVHTRPARVATKPHPRLVNRGPTGLLHKLPDRPAHDLGFQQPNFASGRKDNIAPALEALTVPIDSLILDPENARVHPERNLKAIMGSLTLYGQLKPLVVRREGMMIVAGNGTWIAAKALGWTKIAANIQEMTALESAGYGLADNRTAELASWNTEIVARISRLMQEAKVYPVGWSLDELEVLLAASWQKPEIEEGNFGGEGNNGKLVLAFNPDQAMVINQATAEIRQLQEVQDMPVEECVVAVMARWLKGK